MKTFADEKILSWYKSNFPNEKYFLADYEKFPFNNLHFSDLLLFLGSSPDGREDWKYCFLKDSICRERIFKFISSSLGISYGVLYRAFFVSSECWKNNKKLACMKNYFLIAGKENISFSTFYKKSFPGRCSSFRYIGRAYDYTF